LRFEDTPDIAVKKIGSFPVTGNADELTGYYVWRLPEYLLHVGYSVLEQRVNRIYIASHPYYASELLESPLLQSPPTAVPKSDSASNALPDVWAKPSPA